MTTETKFVIKIIFKAILVLLTCLVAIVLIYSAYLIFSYSRIDDNQDLSITGRGKVSVAKTSEPYTIVTQNIGFGAYTKDFTFFMDGGKNSWAKSKESIVNCISLAVKEVKSVAPDFALLQEIDIDSTRSYHMNELELIRPHFSEYQEVFACNYHSAFLMYPLLQPHGTSNSGMATYSKIDISSALRRKLPISEGFSKFLDLDRCYSVSRIPVENGKELLIYNIHSSAYGGDDNVRENQMMMLFNDMKTEYNNGNYCICGGDFNHDFTGNSTQELNGGEHVDFGWAKPFPTNMIPDGIIHCVNYSSGIQKPTCRNDDIPYVEGNFTFISDGFLVSENVSVTYLENIVTGFVYSDHNPVVMSFTLK